MLLLAVAVFFAVVAAAVAVVITSREGAPATGAASVVPDDALAYIHLSTDPDRQAVKQALQRAAKLPDFALFSGQLTGRLGAVAAGGTRVNFQRDIRPWLGNEAALALLNTQSSTAGSLIVLDVRKPAKARSFIAGAGATSAGVYEGTGLYRYRTGTELAFVRHYMVLGQPASVRSAIDAAAGRLQPLSANGAYQRAAAGEPADRVLDAYASPAGVRRLLVPQGGMVAAVGALLYQPTLTGVTLSVSAAAGGANLRVHSTLDPNLQPASGPRTAQFTPTLDKVMPSGSMLLLDVTGLDRIASHMLQAGATGGVVRGLGPLLSRLGSALQSQGVNVKGIVSLFHGETAVAIGPATTSRRKGSSGSPPLIIVTRTAHESATATQLANLEVPLSQLFPAPSSGSGQVPQFSDHLTDGVTAHQLSLAPGLELDYAVFRGLVVISTSLNGIGAVASHTRALADQPSYSAALGSRPQQVSSLVFLDFNQLLSLAEQTGLFRGSRYRLLRPDLERVRAVGLTSTRGEADSTAELFLQIS
ncbi:MAG: DUF3352 domain-containing protein [Actinobacteria bacterium]|nr:MAG: DUF3352 domain-containing protein [Actinomycetota bacterium]